MGSRPGASKGGLARLVIQTGAQQISSLPAEDAFWKTAEVTELCQECDAALGASAGAPCFQDTRTDMVARQMTDAVRAHIAAEPDVVRNPPEWHVARPAPPLCADVRVLCIVVRTAGDGQRLQAPAVLYGTHEADSGGDVWDALSGDELGSGSDFSFNGGASKIVQRIKDAAAADNPGATLEKMCRSYEIVELEGAEPEAFREAAAAFAAGLQHRKCEARPAFARALGLAARAVQGSAESLLVIAGAVAERGAQRDAIVAGAQPDAAARDHMSTAADLVLRLPVGVLSALCELQCTTSVAILPGTKVALCAIPSAPYKPQ